MLPAIDLKYELFLKKASLEIKERLDAIGKPQLGILWSRDSLGFKRLCGNNPGTMWSTF